MTKEQKQLGVIIAGVFFLVIVLAGNFSRKKNAGPAEITPGRAPEQAGGPAAGLPQAFPANSSVLEDQKKRGEGAWGKDPFSSDVYRSGQADSELRLMGISLGKDKDGFAFINGQIVKKGDFVGDYEVMEILKDRVMLKRENQSFFLAFPEE